MTVLIGFCRDDVLVCAADDRLYQWPERSGDPLPPINKILGLGPELWLLCSLAGEVTTAMRTHVQRSPLDPARRLAPLRLEIARQANSFHNHWLTALRTRAHLGGWGDVPAAVERATLFLCGRHEAGARPELWIATSQDDFSWRDATGQCAVAAPEPTHTELVYGVLERMAEFPTLEDAFIAAVLAAHQHDPARVGAHGHVYSCSANPAVTVAGHTEF